MIHTVPSNSMRAGRAGVSAMPSGMLRADSPFEHVGLGGDGLDIGAGANDADGCLSGDDGRRGERDVKGIRSGVGLEKDVGRSDVCAGGQGEREKAAEQG